MEILCVGSGSILTDRTSSCFLIDERVMVDVPNGAIKSMRRLGRDPRRIDILLVTHLHADHFFDSVFLLLENGLRQERHTPLIIVGPKQTESHLRSLFELAYPESVERVWNNCKLRFFAACEPSLTADLCGYAVQSERVVHADMDAYGYHVRESTNGRSVAFSGDTEMCSGVKSLVENSSLTFVDLAFIEGRKGHMGVKDYFELSQIGKVVGTHLSPDAREVALSNTGIRICEDGEVFDVR